MRLEFLNKDDSSFLREVKYDYVGSFYVEENIKFPKLMTLIKEYFYNNKCSTAKLIKDNRDGTIQDFIININKYLSIDYSNIFSYNKDLINELKLFLNDESEDLLDNTNMNLLENFVEMRINKIAKISTETDKKVVILELLDNEDNKHQFEFCVSNIYSAGIRVSYEKHNLNEEMFLFNDLIKGKRINEIKQDKLDITINLIDESGEKKVLSIFHNGGYNTYTERDSMVMLMKKLKENIDISEEFEFTTEVKIKEYTGSFLISANMICKEKNISALMFSVFTNERDKELAKKVKEKANEVFKILKTNIPEFLKYRDKYYSRDKIEDLSFLLKTRYNQNENVINELKI